LETIDAAQKTMAILYSRVENTRKQEIMAPISSIDSGAFDNHVLPHGKWPISEENVEATAMESN
jgi:hypothetical protein